MLPPTSLVTKPAGEWNSYHITINHNNNQGLIDKYFVPNKHVHM